MRLVRAADGAVQVDEAGKAPGRGAYLCRARSCWARGAAGALTAALRTTINATDREALLTYGVRFEAPTAPTATTGGDGADAPPDPPDAADGARDSTPERARERSAESGGV